MTWVLPPRESERPPGSGSTRRMTSPSPGGSPGGCEEEQEEEEEEEEEGREAACVCTLSCTSRSHPSQDSGRDLELPIPPTSRPLVLAVLPLLLRYRSDTGTLTKLRSAHLRLKEGVRAGDAGEETT
jgi:hypothetical protein